MAGQEYCPSCKKVAVTFMTRYTMPTLPKDGELQKEFVDTNCSFCGIVISQAITEITNE